MALYTTQEKIALLIAENIKIASDLLSANRELAYQNIEKERRAAELVIANKELVYQNKEKEQRAAELIIANKELANQNIEKERRAAELVIANKELVYQNAEKEKRTAELLIANKELEQLTYIASHDLQEPLRTISNYLQIFEEDYLEKLDDEAFTYLRSVNNATKRMSALVKGILNFSRLGQNKILSYVDIGQLTTTVIADLDTLITNSNAVVDVGEMPEINVYELEFRQLLQNLITNSIKFQTKHSIPVIKLSSCQISTGWHFTISDNGIGIAPAYFNRVFDIFQRLHIAGEYEGTGIGLANCKKVVELHHGKIWIDSVPGAGTNIYFTIPNLSI
jgi:light-regulated signal transduction histidine kinase (bacteriophytochrome)